ncbi:MAG: hypothetical protein NVS9B8_03420 [Candidatus Limnocylindrales bacterium]
MLAVLLAGVGDGTAGCALGCPTALAFGTVAASGSDLVLQDDSGAAEPVVWPDGYHVRRDGEGLVLTDRLGTVKARVGESVEMGGGVGADNRFHGCGDVVVVVPHRSGG